MDQKIKNSVFYKRTILVGFAFFFITMFWQCYDAVIPKILTDKFGLSQTLSGIIMALDNVLALFLLPLFGSISDRCKAKMGRRKPYILIGTILASLLFVGLSVADNLQLAQISDIADSTSVEATDTEAREKALALLYDTDLGDVSKNIRDNFTKEEFVKISVVDDKGDMTEDYQKYVLPARQSYARMMTMSNPLPIILFIAILLMVLISMSIFRSPAVALMPDTTPKPLRSQSNAIINLMGTVGGFLVLVLGIVFGTGKIQNSLMSYTVYFTIISCVMLIALTVFMLTVKEPEWARQALETDRANGITDEEEEKLAAEHKRHLTKGELRSLVFLLLSVAFWYIGYNAVTSKYSIYASEILGRDYNTTLIVALAVATVSFIPVAQLSKLLGRKKTILCGVGLLCTTFVIASFIGSDTPSVIMNLLFALAGIGWASININSFPMVVELATGSDVGRYTGLYYSASMAAQIVAPILSGLFLDNISMRALFPFGAIFVGLSFVTMLFVRHGDAKPVISGNILEQMGENDS